jgi:hypothetical protein
MKGPAATPCNSCPYRTDVPSGVWAAEEYEKLPTFDLPTEQHRVFLCHKAGDNLCAGWCGTHEVAALIGPRIMLAAGDLSPEDYAAACDYVSPIPLFESGAAAAEHGMRDIEHPSEEARLTVARVTKYAERNLARVQAARAAQ